MKFILRLIISFILFFICYINVNAIEISDIKPLTQCEIPNSMNFSVSSACFGHDYFLQADADEYGNFVIYSLCDSPASEEEKIYRTKYIDLYNKDGQFICEISFTSSETGSVRIYKGLIYAIMFNEMIVYNSTDDTVKYYEFNGNSIWEASPKEISRTQKFSVGEYNYRIEGNLNMDFVKFIRSEGETEKILIEMHGTKNILGRVGNSFSLPLFIAAFVIVSIIFIPKIYKRIKIKNPQRYSTERQ